MAPLLLPVLLLPALLLWSGPSLAQAGVDPFLVLLHTDDGPTSDQLFFFSMATGSGSHATQIRRNPEVLKVRGLSENLYESIGREKDPSVREGAVLFMPILQSDGTSRSAIFVETSTGYTTYYDDMGKGGKLGKLITLIGRPFGPIASTDANFALVPRRDDSGRTEGAYLVHGTTGRGLYIAGLQDLELAPEVSTTNGLPEATGYISAAPIYRSEATASIALLDQGTGQLSYLDTGSNPSQLTQRAPALQSLNELFVTEGYNPISTRRFSLLPLQDADENTTGLAVVDVATGQFGLLENPGTPGSRLRIAARTIYDVIAGGKSDQARSFALVAHEESSGTAGLWLLDSLTRSLVYIDNLRDPARLRLRPVTFDR